jgi:uncharacterized protein YyaL (SSP411 family)
MLRFSPNPNLAHLIRWLEWDQNAFEKARAESKPVMLFLAAFWCRYCQRMDEQAFSDRESMALLNAYFIALRTEEAMRPDIDARYNLNGWPTVAFFSPAGELLAAANFLAVEDFKTLLLDVYLAYHKTKAEKRPNPPVPASMGMLAVEPADQGVLDRITDSIMALTDPINGGYGRSQKFIHAPVNDFLLSRYQATANAAYLDHVRLTLDRMREGPIHDVEGGGYFRTTTGTDWTEPHREKLLVEQAGLLANCLDLFRLTGSSEYARMADDLIGYIDARLVDDATGAFFGCEDFLRRESPAESNDELFSIIDRCIYTDANAVVASAYLRASALLGRADCRDRAFEALDFLWDRCRDIEGSLNHYYDGAPRLPGLLRDQALTGTAMLDAYDHGGGANYLERAQRSAEFMLARLRNPAGGFYDRQTAETEFLRLRLTDPDQNGAAASLFLRLAEVTAEPKYREAAHWALRADAAACDLHAARFGRAIGEFLGSAKRGAKSASD